MNKKCYANDNEDYETNISFDMRGLPRHQQRQRKSVILQLKHSMQLVDGNHATRRF